MSLFSNILHFEIYLVIINITVAALFWLVWWCILLRKAGKGTCRWCQKWWLLQGLKCKPYWFHSVVWDFPMPPRTPYQTLLKEVYTSEDLLGNLRKEPTAVFGARKSWPLLQRYEPRGHSTAVKSQNLIQKKGIKEFSNAHKIPSPSLSFFIALRRREWRVYLILKWMWRFLGESRHQGSVQLSVFLLCNS